MHTMSHKGYTARVTLDERDNILVGRILGILSIVSFHGETVTELRAGFESAVDDYLAECKEQGSRPTSAMEWEPYIATDPEIMHGVVCFRGTRVPVSVVLDNLAAGLTPEYILDQYRSLKPEHVPAALAYAADLVR